MNVDLPPTDWIIVVAAMRNGVKEIPDDELSDQAEALIDNIITQAELDNEDLADLNDFYM